MQNTLLQFGLFALALIAVTVLTLFGKTTSDTAVTVIIGAVTYALGHANGLTTSAAINGALPPQGEKP